MKPKVIDPNRWEKGDYFEKPTQYWFVNREPKNNLVFEAVSLKPKGNISRQKNEKGVNKTVLRSMISPDYANRFIREFVIDESMHQLQEKA